MADCIDCTELLSRLDAGRYAAAQAAHETRLAALAQAPTGPLRDYAQAKVRLHQALAQPVFHHEGRGAGNLRQAARLIQTAARRYLTGRPVRKTLGLGQLGIGSLPAGYHWRRRLGRRGRVGEGWQSLALAAVPPHDF